MNEWQGPVGSTWILVYAGTSDIGEASAAPAEPADGDAAVAVYSEGDAPDYSLTTVGVLTIPGGPGSLNITSASNQVLTLQDSDGSSHTLNLVTDTLR